MKVLLLGSGGREHALYWKLKQSPGLTAIQVAPGNGGIAERDTITDAPLGNADAFKKFVQKEKYDLVVCGPEQPLVEGWLDPTRSICPVFGPTKEAAQLEGSKSFAKEFMQRHKIPTAAFQRFNELAGALVYIEDKKPPFVIKADGLAAGKGVSICQTHAEAEKALSAALIEGIFGEAGRTVVIEEFLTGPEASVFALCDGKRALPFRALQDHKRAYDNDEGPNTGGMGAYQPVPFMTKELQEKVQKRILDPVLAGMAAEGMPYRGLLYAGLMICEGEPYVIEFNVRFGDPETQALLPVVDEDLLELFYQSAAGNLPDRALRHKNQASLTVVIAAEGYPGSYKKGIPLKIFDSKQGDIIFFHAGTAKKDTVLVSSGGRILNITAPGSDLKEARRIAYEALDGLELNGTFYRRDIGSKGIDISSGTN
jgi:phosphoribosylamine--glycine ligase